MKVYVDADACPVVDEVIEIVGDRSIEIVHNRHHEHSFKQSNVDTHETGDRSDAADHYIYNNMDPDDLVVTDDLGLAALVLGKGGHVIRFRGDRPTQENIELKLSLRDAAARERRKSNRVKGPPEFTESDRESFCDALRSFISVE